MKRLLATMVLLAGSTTMAMAHTLPGDEGVAVQLDHQLFDPHHLPLTILVIAVGSWALRRISRRQS